jgi:membrane-associated phospholipid phosphatase
MTDSSPLPLDLTQRRIAIPLWPAVFIALLIPEAMLLDHAVAKYVHVSGLKERITQWPHQLLVIRVPGNFWAYTIPACLWMLMGARTRWKPGERAAAILGAAVCTILNILSTLRLPDSRLLSSTMAMSLPQDAFWSRLAAMAALLMIAWLLIPGPLDRDRLDQATAVFLAGLISGINWFFKWCFGRTRPFQLNTTPFEFHPFGGGFRGLGGHPPRPFSFPSGDVSLAFAMAVALGWVSPRHRRLVWTLAFIVLIERIAENAHYVSDTVGGIALGWASASAAFALVYRIANRRDRLGRKLASTPR